MTKYAIGQDKNNIKSIILCSLLASLAVGCSSDDDLVNSAGTLVDPIEPVVIDTSIGGNFEGAENIPNPEDIEPEPDIEIIYNDSVTNTLTDADIQRAPEFTYEAFVAAYNSVTFEFPDINTAGNEFANAIIDQLVLSSANEDTPNARSIFDQFNILTEAEKGLVLRNPVKGVRTKFAADDAREVTLSLFTGSQFLTRADAFRHAYWNWLMSDCCTVEWATAFATAHESANANDDDKRMDLNNNMIGRRVYSAASSATATEAQASLLQYDLLWVNSDTKNVTVGVDYLVYLEPQQKMQVFDDGPEFDDIYTITLNNETLGDTPAGGSRDYNFDQLLSGTFPLTIFCKLDGTEGGCGFQIVLSGASILTTGMQTTSQIVIQEDETHNDTLTFPNMNDARVN